MVTERHTDTNIYCIARRNLKMTPGKQAAQCVHAALALKQKDAQAHWAVVVLEVSDKRFEEYKAAKNCVVIHDAGLTEVERGTETVLAFYGTSSTLEGTNAHL